MRLVAGRTFWKLSRILLGRVFWPGVGGSSVTYFVVSAYREGETERSDCCMAARFEDEVADASGVSERAGWHIHKRHNAI